MSTYIQGVTDYIPRIQPFRPDYNFYGGALNMKQTQYDTNHSKVSSLYGSLLNAPMLRDQNIKAREDYFNAINGEIQKVSGLDLSKQENTHAAANLFKGLYENDNIVKDMAWTRSFHGEMKRAEGFRNCVDAEKCGGSYWEGGVKALNYRADEFRKATDEQALHMGNANYTPYQNVMEMAVKAAKDAGLNITVDQLQGRYITTTKNGPMLIDPLNSLFTGLFANNESVMDYYKTKAYVDRKDWIMGNAGALGGEEQAELAYLTNVSEGMSKMFNQSLEDVNSRVNNFGSQKKQLEEQIEKEGTIPGSSLAMQYQELNNMEGQAMSSQQSYKEANATFNNAMNPEMRAMMGSNIDAAMASMYLAGDINNAAQTLAYKDYEFKMKADPYALENTKQANRIALEDMKFENRKLLEKFKYDLKDWEDKKASMGGSDDNVPILQRIVEGGAEINLEDGAAFKMYKDKEGNLVKDISGGERSILTEMLNLTQLKSKNENGAGLATDDLVKFGDIIFNEIASEDARYYSDEGDYGDYVSNSSLLQHNRQLKEKWSNMTYDQKVKYAQEQDFNKLINNSGLSGTVLDNVYADFALPLIDQTNESNRVNRSYLGGLWSASSDARTDIELKNTLLKNMGTWYTSETDNVIQNMKSSEEYAALAPVMRLYIDPETGAKRSMEDFAIDFAKMYGDSEEFDSPNEAYSVAIDMYKGEEISGFEMETSLEQMWAEAFSKYMSPDGGAMALGLIGSDSQAGMGLMFPSVDPAKYASGATMNTISFMNDMFGAGEEASRFVAGTPNVELPENSSPTMEAFFGQLYSDMVSNKDPKDSKRPILNVTYQDIAGGDSEWSALNVKVNQDYLTGYVGSESNPKLLTSSESNALQTDGFTMYLKKDGAQNGFRQSVEKSPIEQTMFYTGEYAFDSYPEITQDLKLKQNPKGGYILSGNVMAGVDTDGQPIWEPMYNPLTNLSTNPTDVVAGINAWLGEVAVGNKSITTNYNAVNGTKNPQELLNQ